MKFLFLNRHGVALCLLLSCSTALAMRGSTELRQAAFVNKLRALLPLSQLATYDIPLSRLLRWSRGERSLRELARTTQVSHVLILTTEKGTRRPERAVSIEALAAVIGRSPQQLRALIAMEELIEHYHALKEQGALPAMDAQQMALLARADAVKQTAESWAAKSRHADGLLGALLAITPEDLGSYAQAGRVYRLSSQTSATPAAQRTALVDRVLRRYASLRREESPQAIDAVLEEYLAAKGYDLDMAALREQLQAAHAVRPHFRQRDDRRGSRLLSVFSAAMAELTATGSDVAVSRLSSFAKPFGVHVREVRGTRSLATVSQRAGFDFSMLRRYETGQAFPKAQRLLRLSAVLDLDVQVMLDTIATEKIIKNYDLLRLEGRLPVIAADLHKALETASAARMMALSKSNDAELNLSTFWRKLQETSAERLRAFQRTFGSHLWAAMQEKGYDAVAVYDRSGIKPAWIEAYLQGLDFPRPRNLQKLTEILGLSLPRMAELIATEAAVVSYHFFTEVRLALIALPDEMHALLQKANTSRLADSFQRRLARSGFTEEAFATFQPFAVHLEDARQRSEAKNELAAPREHHNWFRQYWRGRGLPTPKLLQGLTTHFEMDLQAMQRLLSMEKLLLTYSKLKQQHPGFAALLPATWRQVLEESLSRTALTHFISQSGRMLRAGRAARQYTRDDLAAKIQRYFPEHTSATAIKHTLLAYEHHRALPVPQVRPGLAQVLGLRDADLAAAIAQDRATMAAQLLQRERISIRLSVHELDTYQGVAAHLWDGLAASGLTAAQVATALVRPNGDKDSSHAYHLHRFKRYLRGEMRPMRAKLERLQQILHLDRQLVFRDAEIEKYLVRYQKLLQKHGDLPLPLEVRRALDRALAKTALPQPR